MKEIKGLPDKPSYTPIEIAPFFGVNERTIKDWIKADIDFDSSRVLIYRSGGVRIPREEVLRVYNLMLVRRFSDVEQEKDFMTQKPKLKRKVRSGGI